MAKDKMLQMASFERKKDKWDKRRETERGSGRVNEKTTKKMQKEEQHARLKEMKDGRTKRVADGKVWKVQLIVSAAIIVAYVVILMFVLPNGGDGAPAESADQAAAPLLVPAAVTAGAALALAGVCWSMSGWRDRLAKEEEQREAASQIKGSLERKLTEKEREQRAKARRQQQVKEVKARLQRRAEEQAQSVERAREIARVLRLRRERRLAEEAAEAAQKADGGRPDERGWTAGQRRSLREAASKYPEGWSHARKRRWDMIAAEVEGHDARACEEELARLEAEARGAAASAKLERQRAPAGPGLPARGLEDDLDWMGSTAAGESGDDALDDDMEEEDEEEESRRPRMALELEPEHKGTEIRLLGIKAMQGCVGVQVELLHLQLTCADCRTTTQVYLSGADEDACDAKTWCEGCSGLISVHLRPTLLHAESSRLCYVDCVRCVVTDMLPSVLMSTCEACDAPNVHKQEFLRNRMVHGTCFECHSKYVFGAESIKIEQVTPCDPGKSCRADGTRKQAGDNDADPMDEIAEELRYLRKKAKSDPRQQLIKLGSPLPQMGACKHFKKSYKWYRFACCGRAFPCPECHVESGCPAAALGAHASRMICGKCSMEQAYSPARACEKCGFSMQPKGSAHWDDGAGTRNLAVMSAKDAKKFKGGLRQANSKVKTGSQKSARVGAKAKAAREHAQKFGRGG